MLYEKIKLLLKEIETLGTNVSNIPATEIPNAHVVKPNKQYISVSEILELFNITKNEYSNILVRII